MKARAAITLGFDGIAENSSTESTSATTAKYFNYVARFTIVIIATNEFVIAIVATAIVIVIVGSVVVDFAMVGDFGITEDGFARYFGAVDCLEFTEAFAISYFVIINLRIKASNCRKMS